MFGSYYDTDGDGVLSGFERVRYEEDNWAYPGSQVPDSAVEAYERGLRAQDRGAGEREYSYEDYCRDEYGDLDAGLDDW